MPDVTRRLLHDGWLDTGDLGFVFEGELYLTGRVKDLIIRAGRHIHPQAIEQAVGALTGIRRGRVAAFGSIVGEEGTERLVVVAETRVTQPEPLAALRLQVNAVVEAISGGPADDVVLAAPGSVLKTSSGKLRRSACRSAYEAGTLGKAHTRAIAAVLLRGLTANLRSRLKRLGALAYAAYAWSLFALLAIAAALAVAVLPTPALRWHGVRACARLLRAASGVRIDVNREQAWPKQPSIFVANHASYLDVFVLIWVLPRPVAFTAKAELAEQAILRWLLRRFGVSFVERFDPRRSTEVVGEVQSERRDFLFFPEGTVYRMPGLRRFHLGAFVAAAQANMPVVPIALRGTRAVMRDVEWFPRLGTIEVSVGDALIPQPDADRWHEALRLSASARHFLLEHCGEPDAEASP
jgi:1-acyl-sn-glycerol-3-phosphate acyltransferase